MIPLDQRATREIRTQEKESGLENTDERERDGLTRDYDKKMRLRCEDLR